MHAELHHHQRRLRMNLRTEWKPLALLSALFLGAYYMPLGSPRFQWALVESAHMLRDYARDHVVMCLLPALLIAGAISVFLKGEAVIRYLGAGARKLLAYAVASVSGAVLAVCSCSVLPLFAGIYTRGAGIGPATAFLYAGPAVNVLAVILTARILGPELGAARAIGAVLFSIVIGASMSLIFRRSERERQQGIAQTSPVAQTDRSHRTLRTGAIFLALLSILVFTNWGSGQGPSCPCGAGGGARWILPGISAGALLWMLAAWYGVAWWKPFVLAAVVILTALLTPGGPTLPFAVALFGFALILATTPGDASRWMEESWGYTKQIIPLLFAGVLAAGFLLGRPGNEALIPSRWVEAAVGGNSLWANLAASVAGAFMYFATLTEVPILQGLIGAGMGKGPALALLLAGPALSLPSMLVIGSIMGARKAITYVSLVIVMATLSGLLFGALV
jgi:uncharacterized protein